MSIEDRRTDEPIDRIKTLTRELDELRAMVIGRAGGTVYPNGSPAVIVGPLPDGSYGIEILNQNGRVVQKQTATGAAYPFQPVVAYPSGGAIVSTSSGNFRPGTTSAGFAEIWRADFWSIGDQVVFDITAYANAGNMDWRILCYENGASPFAVASYTATGGATVAWPQNETTNAQRSGAFTIPSGGLLSGTDPVGRSMTMRIEARKNSGAVSVDFAVNGPFQNHG